MKLVIIRHARSNKAAGLPGEPDVSSPAGHEQIAELIEIENGQVFVAEYTTE